MDNAMVETMVTGLATTDFSLMALFMRADWVVKLVMLGLIAASIMCWTIIFSKIARLHFCRKMGMLYATQFYEKVTLQGLYKQARAKPVHPFGVVLMTAVDMQTHYKNKNAAQFAERLHYKLTCAVDNQIAALQNGLIFLAGTGAVAPFIGLFGTVWGIMNSFQAIAVTQDTNLAVVAPGIAEALFATGLGLLAAIPAVIAYNKFSADINRFAQNLDEFAYDVNDAICHK